MGDEVSSNGRAMRAFSTFIASLDGGRLHGQLSSDLEDLVAKMQDVAGGNMPVTGKLTLSVDLKYDPKSGVFDVGGDYKIVSPKEPRGRSVFWATEGNVLTPDNPRQMKMFPRDVNASRSEAKTV